MEFRRAKFLAYIEEVPRHSEPVKSTFRLARTSGITLDEEQHGPEGARRFSYLPTCIFRSIRQLHLILR